MVTSGLSKDYSTCLLLITKVTIQRSNQELIVDHAFALDHKSNFTKK